MSNSVSILAWSDLDDFIHIIETFDLHGLSFQHITLCERRAWLHLRRIDYAHLDERMKIGLALHDVSKSRDASVEGLQGLAPDRLDWKNHIVFEAKGGSGAQHAVAMQTAIYAILLTHATKAEWTASNDLLRQKRLREIAIDQSILDELIESARRLRELCLTEKAPKVVLKPLCHLCSYRHLCGVK